MSGVGLDAFCSNLANFTNKAKIINKLINFKNKAKITNKLVILALAFRFRKEYYFTRGMGLLGTGVRGWRSGQMRCPGLDAMPFVQT